MAYKVATDEQPAESPAAEESTEETKETQVQEEVQEQAEEKEEEQEESKETKSEEETQEEEETEDENRKKPPRAERRIKELVQENQQLKTKLEQTSQNRADKPDDEIHREKGSELPWRRPEAGDQEVMELDQTQLDELISRRVEERIQSREQATEQRKQAQDWLGDYESLTDSKSAGYVPELDPKSQSYNPELDDLLTSVVSNPDGTPKFNVKVSEALGKIRKSLNIAEKKGTEKASVKLAKQAEEGALTPGESSESDEHEYTENELKELRINNPREYNRLIKAGKI